MSLKYTFYIVATLFTLKSYASEVKITSFIYTGARTSTAELCGKVTTKFANPVIVDITVDPKRNNPGSYTVVPAASGKFCTVVNTESGNADVALRGTPDKMSVSVTK